MLFSIFLNVQYCALFVRFFILCVCSGNANENFFSNRTVFKPDVDSNRQKTPTSIKVKQCIRDETESESLSLHWFGKDLPWQKRLVLRRKKKSELHKHWRNTRGLVFLKFILLCFLISTS